MAGKVFFCNSGAEANEAAIKLARRHASNRGIDKPVIITAHNSFHGRTLAALTATAQPKYHKGFGYDGGKMVPGFKYVPYNDPAALEAAVKEIQANDGEGLAAIMMEALQGEGGIVPGQDAFFTKIRQLCDETGALMICDEVQVGMGRSGKLWGYENLPVMPDVFTSAKALGGGVPIGAMMAAPVVADVFGPGDHASTYVSVCLCAAFLMLLLLLLLLSLVVSTHVFPLLWTHLCENSIFLLTNREAIHWLVLPGWQSPSTFRIITFSPMSVLGENS